MGTRTVSGHAEAVRRAVRELRVAVALAIAPELRVPPNPLPPWAHVEAERVFRALGEREPQINAVISDQPIRGENCVGHPCVTCGAP